jgi:ABC-type Fe3+-hydroxamate transport system substrate-binding protein
MLLSSCSSENQPNAQTTEHTDQIKIIALAPHLAELTESAGATKNLVGITAYVAEDDKFKGIQIVGDAFKLDYEAIIALNPDYILSWKGGTPDFIRNKLQSLNFEIVEIDIQKLADIPKALTVIAQLSSTQVQAQKQIELFSQQLKLLKNSYRPRFKTFIQTYDKPLYTISAKHWMSEAAALCGYDNIFEDLNQLSATVSLESVLSKNPETIINVSDKEDQQWQNWPNVLAVKNKRIINISPDVFSRPSMAILQGIKQLCKY